jgi:hypothetical protein
VEEGLRGGISMISSRFSRANNPYVPDYDPDQETSYVMYLDANNLTRIHRVLVFQQNPWLKAYIDFNTERKSVPRMTLRNMNNAVFGKTMENLRKRVNVKLINDKTKLTKLTARPSFDSFRIFSEDLAAVNLKKTKLYLNRPIYVGFTILDLSKVLMYQFHYEYMKQKYGDNAKLLFTNTDSLCYEMKTRDIYQDMLEDTELFDTSEYIQDHPLYSIKTRKFSVR